MCAGQILGLRLAIYGVNLLGHRRSHGDDRKRLVSFVEIDRCATDAVPIVTGCRLGKRALKFRDFGKVAATFCDLQDGSRGSRGREGEFESSARRRCIRRSRTRMLSRCRPTGRCLKPTVRYPMGSGEAGAGGYAWIQGRARGLRGVRRRHQLQARSRAGRPVAVPSLRRRALLRGHWQREDRSLTSRLRS